MKMFGKMIYNAFSSLFVSVLYIVASDPCFKAVLLLWMYRSYTLNCMFKYMFCVVTYMYMFK